MSIYCITALSIGVVCLYFGTRKPRRQRNRIVIRQAPSHLCKRNQPGAVP